MGKQPIIVERIVNLSDLTDLLEQMWLQIGACLENAPEDAECKALKKRLERIRGKAKEAMEFDFRLEPLVVQLSDDQFNALFGKNV